MKGLLFSIFIASAFISQSKELIIFPEFILTKTEPAPELKPNEAIFVIKLVGIEIEDMNSSVVYSVDGNSFEDQLNGNSFEIKTTPGDHILQVYLDGYYEMYSDTLTIDKQTRAYYENYPMQAVLPVTVDKPVIYLYAEKPTEFEVTVAPKGEFSFTYPKYSDGWKGTTNSDGTLQIEGENYRYLFWESKQELNVLNPESQEGFVLKSEDVLSFLETTLDEVGFTSEEKADFITFWAPKMIQFDQIFLTIDQDQECNRFAELEISPTPQNVHRFYISWGPYSGNHIPTPPRLSKINRSGFTVIEWGGQKIQVNQPKEL